MPYDNRRMPPRLPDAYDNSFIGIQFFAAVPHVTEDVTILIECRVKQGEFSI